MIQTNNYSSYAIQNDGERYSWASFLMIIILSSIIGDTIILVGSIKYKAIRLHGFIVTLMEHIAVSDIILSVTYVFPDAVSLVADGWVMGDFFFYLTFYTKYHVYFAGILLVAVLTTVKLALLHFPLRATAWSRKRAHLVSAVLWIICLFFPISFLVVAKDDVYFDYNGYNCDYKFSAPVWRWLLPLGFISLSIVPVLVVMVTSLLILVKANITARRGGSNLLWEGVVTVLLTAAVYSVSFFPVAVWYCIPIHLKEDPPGPVQAMFRRVSLYLSMLNIMSNFFIYTLTVSSFRKFLKSRVRMVVSCFCPSKKRYSSYQMAEMKKSKSDYNMPRGKN